MPHRLNDVSGGWPETLPSPPEPPRFGLGKRWAGVEIASENRPNLFNDTIMRENFSYENKDF